MALDFPNAPTLNQTFAGPSGVIWQWDGAKWINGTVGTAYAPLGSPAFIGDPTAPTPPAGDADTSLATTAFVQTAVAPAFNGVGRNLLHNPLFNVAQRGAGPFTTANAFALDRWALSLSLDTMSVTQAAFSDAARTQVGDEAAAVALANTFVGNAGASAFNRIVQRIENVRRLAGKTLTVSIWAAAGSGAPKLGVNINQLFGTGGSPSPGVNVAGQAVTISTTYTRYSLTFAVPSIAGKTLGTNNDHSTELSIWFSSGTTQAASAGNIGVQSGTVVLWGMQLEIGSVATPLEKPDPRYDLANCQRFYQVGNIALQGYAGSAVWQQLLGLPATMRALPTVTPTWTTQTNCSGSGVSGYGSAIEFHTTAGAGAQFVLAGTFTASADL